MGFLVKACKVVAVIAFTEVTYQVYRIVYKYVKDRAEKEDKNDHLIVGVEEMFAEEEFPELPKTKLFNKLLVFPDPGITCKRTMAGRTCRNSDCHAQHNYTSLAYLVKMIGLAERSIDVCMYLFTNDTLGIALVNAHENDLLVRVITDDRNSAESGEVNGAQMGRLRTAGISVCCHASSFWMHHKFMIIDNRLVASGSFNWTNAGAMGNYENCIVTTQPEIVYPLCRTFNQLWKAFQPNIGPHLSL